MFIFGLKVALIGMSIVFVALIFLIYVIYAVSAVTKALEGLKTPPDGKNSETAANTAGRC